MSKVEIIGVWSEEPSTESIGCESFDLGDEVFLEEELPDVAGVSELWGGSVTS